MRRTLCLTASLLMAASSQAGIVFAPFHAIHWNADGIAVGQIVTVEERTIHVRIEQWTRDRTGAKAPEVLVYRYTPPTDIPVANPPESYDVGSRYLLLMTKRHADGSGDNPYWGISWQLQLGALDVCIDGPYPWDGRCEETHQKRVKVDVFLDAIQTFDSCFAIQDDPTKGSIPTEQICSNEDLQAWSARSSFHELLAGKALERMRKIRNGGV